MEPGGMGRALFIFGIVAALVGLGLMHMDKLPFLRHLGRLPGDLFYRGERWGVYFPLMTSLIISIVLTILFNIFRK